MVPISPGLTVVEPTTKSADQQPSIGLLFRYRANKRGAVPVFLKRNIWVTRLFSGICPKSNESAKKTIFEPGTAFISSSGGDSPDGGGVCVFCAVAIATEFMKITRNTIKKPFTVFCFFFTKSTSDFIMSCFIGVTTQVQEFTVQRSGLGTRTALKTRIFKRIQRCL